MIQKKCVLGIFVFVATVFAGTAFALPTFQYLLVDSDTPQKNVGFVMTVSTENNPTPVTPVPPNADHSRHVLTFLPLPKAGGDIWKIGLRVNKQQIPYTSLGLLFTSNDCTGSPWIGELMTEPEFSATFDPHVVVGNTLNPNVRSLYVADPTTPLSPSTEFNSSINKNNCNAFGVPVSRRAKPAILLDGDLHTTFPGPYNLIFEFIP